MAKTWSDFIDHYDPKTRKNLIELLRAAGFDDPSAAQDQMEEVVFGGAPAIIIDEDFDIGAAKIYLSKINKSASKLLEEIHGKEPSYLALMVMGRVLSQEKLKSAQSTELLSSKEPISKAVSAIWDIGEWSKNSLSILNKNRGRRKKMGAVVGVIRNIAEIWEKLGVKATLRFSESGSEAYGPFLEYIESALPPIMPESKSSMSFESPVRQALDYGRK
jgi:hypothetical protein